MNQFVEQVDKALNWQKLPELARWVVEQAVAIQQIPAPTFEESERADFVADQFRQLGLQHVDVDEVFNAYGLIPGRRGDIPGIMVSAHTDTIFAADADLTIRRGGDRIHGPGLGDNSLGVAALLGLALHIQEAGIVPETDIWIVATSREEGLGDLGGIRKAYERLKPRLASVVNVEGLAFGHVYHAGIAVKRLHISATTPGGHSWLHYGRASAIHCLLDLGARITAIHTDNAPRTTLNIGMIEGGRAVNAIASNASFWLDMRSEERAALDRLEAEVQQQILATQAPELALAVDVVGDRPAGAISPEHPLVQAALATLELQGIRGTLETGSTDGNLPLSEGTPAVTIGISRGGNAHRMDEYIEIDPVGPGMRQIITLALAAVAQAAG